MGLWAVTSAQFWKEWVRFLFVGTDQRILHCAVDFIYQHKFNVVASMPGGLVVVMALWDDGNHRDLVAWYSCLTVLILCRLWLINRYHALERSVAAASANLWGWRFTIGAALTALMWSLSPIFITGPNEIDDHCFIGTMIAGLTAAAVPMYCSFLPAALLYATCATLPFALYCIFGNSSAELALGGSIILFTIFMNVVARHAHEWFCAVTLAQSEKLATADQLLHAMQQVEAANRTKAAFLSSMSHELRTPLNAIIGFSDLMTTRVHGPLGSIRYEEYVKDIHSSGLHLLHIISDLLEMAKIESGRADLDVESVDLAALAAVAVRDLSSAAAHKKLMIQEAYAKDARPVRADLRAARLMVRNLISNAIKFNNPGGLVVIKVQSTAGDTLFSVADTGIGISATNLERCAEPFSPVNGAAYTRTHGGSGLGLALVKRYSELHGGRFDIQSELGAGTTVTLTFPLAAKPAPMPPHVPQLDAVIGGGI